MYKLFILVLLIGWIVIWMPFTSLIAQDTLTVAITPSTPWVIFDATTPPESRTPSGFNIDLWTALAKGLNVETLWLYKDNTAAIFKAVKAHKADVGLVNFPPSTVKLGLQVMVLTEHNLWQVIVQSVKKLSQLLSLKMVLVPLLLFLVAANLRWVLELLSRREHRKFSSNYFLGVYEATWWNFSLLMDWDASGRGLARLFDLFWHFLGLVLLGGFVGLMSAAFTLESVNEQIKKVEDIDSKQVAVLEDALYVQRYLRQRDEATEFVVVKNLQEAVRLLLDMEVSAVVHKGIELERLAKQINNNIREGEQPKVRVLPQIVNRQQYAIVVADKSPHAVAIGELIARFDQPQGLEESLAKRLSSKWKLTLTNE